MRRILTATALTTAAALLWAAPASADITNDQLTDTGSCKADSTLNSTLTGAELHLPVTTATTMTAHLAARCQANGETVYIERGAVATAPFNVVVTGSPTYQIRLKNFNPPQDVTVPEWWGGFNSGTVLEVNGVHFSVDPPVQDVVVAPAAGSAGGSCRTSITTMAKNWSKWTTSRKSSETNSAVALCGNQSSLLP